MACHHIMFYLVFVVSLGILACSSPPPPDPNDSGQRIFYGYERADINCYECHGIDGRGSWQAPAMHLVFVEHDSEYVAHVILKGKGGDDEMPAFEEKLTPAELTALISYVRKLAQVE